MGTPAFTQLSDDEQPSPSTSHRSTSADLPAVMDIAVEPLANLPPVDEVTDEQQWRQYLQDNDKLVPYEKLVWDMKAEHGQVRSFRPVIVKHYVSRMISQGDPVRPVEVMTKMLACSDHCTRFPAYNALFRF